MFMPKWIIGGVGDDCCMGLMMKVKKRIRYEN